MSLTSEPLIIEDVGEIGDIELNIISINTYLNITNVDIQWMDIANSILSDLIAISIPKTVMPIKINSYVEKTFEHSQSILCAANITGVKDLYELDDVIKSASSFGEIVLKKIYKIHLNNLLKGFSFGTSERWFNSYDNLAVLILYAKRDVFREHPDRLDKIKCIDAELMSGLIQIIDEEFTATE
jgi:hypothetical protein